MNTREEFYSVKEVATIFMRSPDSVRRMKTKIGYVRDGKQILFKKSDIDKYIESRYIKPKNVHETAAFGRARARNF